MAYGDDGLGNYPNQPQPWSGAGDPLLDGYPQPGATPVSEGYGVPAQPGYEVQPQVDERSLAVARIAVNTTAIVVDLVPTAFDPESLLAAVNLVSRYPSIARRIPGFGAVSQALLDSTPDVPGWAVAVATGQELVTQFVPSSVLTRLPQIIKDIRDLRAARRAERQQTTLPTQHPPQRPTGPYDTGYNDL